MIASDWKHLHNSLPPGLTRGVYVFVSHRLWQRRGWLDQARPRGENLGASNLIGYRSKRQTPPHPAQAGNPFSIARKADRWVGALAGMGSSTARRCRGRVWVAAVAADRAPAGPAQAAARSARPAPASRPPPHCSPACPAGPALGRRRCGRLDGRQRRRLQLRRRHRRGARQDAADAAPRRAIAGGRPRAPALMLMEPLPRRPPAFIAGGDGHGATAGGAGGERRRGARHDRIA